MDPTVVATVQAMLEEDEPAADEGYNLQLHPIAATVLYVVPLIAFAFVLMSGVSPIRKILKDKSTGDLSPFPFISFYTNCGIYLI